ncbi:hypothetical protein [Acinetobacter faecalis]|uniref:hypothetical protein n=1 Tax=Acinetobacter faecalis TaxID=2665161 RepID=UPI002A9181B8|nr:hypothetical protein [Acinetobacter faecalis]MDY6449926.1 hypothetical protein [Acinetobacter faecalis]
MSQRSNKNRRNQSKDVPQTSYNVWMFARDFFDNIFSLLNTGKIFPVVLLAFLIMIGLVIWKYPDEQLPSLVSGVLSNVGSNWVIVFALLIITNLAWCVLFFAYKSMFEKEITRLSEIRSQLMHGGGDLKKISAHRSSDGPQQEGYIFPNPTNN